MVEALRNPLCLPASPPQGGREAFRTDTNLSDTSNKAGGSPQVISPLVGEMPGRAEGAAAPADVERGLT